MNRMKVCFLIFTIVLGLSLFSTLVKAYTVVTADNGSAVAIQTAVDIAAVDPEGGEVNIPEGTFNFVEDGEWNYPSVVSVPAGISIFGAPNPRDANGHVLNDNYKTVLILPWNAPGNLGQSDNMQWFRFYGSGDSSKPSRFSDIKFIGYRSLDPNALRCGMYDPALVSPDNPGGMIPLSEQCDSYGQDLDPDTTGPEGECTPCSLQNAIRVEDVIDMRIDHCYFENTCGKAVMFSGTVCRGVIDHCKAVNTYGRPYGYDQLTTGYGFYNAIHHLAWDDNIYNVVGHYTNYTIFIEDCYLSHWRHTVVSNYGAHVVFRHNIIEDDYGYGSYDAHGGGSAGDPTLIGTRAVEVYNNKFINPDPNEPVDPSTGIRRGHTEAMWIRGGGGAIFNNIVTGSGTYPGIYDRAIYLSAEAATEGDGTIQFTNPHDIYIWNNDFGDASMWIDPKLTLNLDYFLEQMPLPYNTTNTPNTPGYGGGLTYDNPYPYPHPLTLGEIPTTTTTSTTTTIPSGQVLISGQLKNATGPIQASIIVYNEGTSQINTSDTTDSGGNYGLNVWSDTYDFQYNLLDFYIPTFFIKLISFDVFSSLHNAVNYVNKLSNGISFRVNITTDQEIQVHSEEKPKTVKANGIEMTEGTSPLSPNEWLYASSQKRLYMKVGLPTTTTTTIPATTTTFTTITTTTTTETTTTSTTTTISTGYIFSDGFESGYITEAEGGLWTGTWTTGGETVNVVETDPYQGVYHLSAVSDGSTVGERDTVYKIIDPQTILYMRWYTKIKTVPASGQSLSVGWIMNSTAFNALAAVNIVWDGSKPVWHLRWNDGGTWTGQNSNVEVSADTWYSVELYWKKGTTNGEATMWVNGEYVLGVTGKNTAYYANADRVDVGIIWDDFALENYVDNVVVDDEYIGP